MNKERHLKDAASRVRKIIEALEGACFDTLEIDLNYDTYYVVVSGSSVYVSTYTEKDSAVPETTAEYPVEEFLRLHKA